MKLIKTKPLKKRKKEDKFDQEEFKERFTKTINKQLKNHINVISYREIIDEGMSSAAFWEVIDMFKKEGWKINIKEFDIEIN